MFLRFRPIVVCVLFLWLSDTHCMATPPIRDGHLVCFHVGAISHSAVNPCTNVCVDKFLLDTYLGVALLDHVELHLNLQGTSRPVFKAAVPHLVFNNISVRWIPYYIVLYV